MVDQMDTMRVTWRMPVNAIVVPTMSGNMAPSQQLMEMLGVRP
jgi:hypothetical protein